MIIANGVLAAVYDAPPIFNEWGEPTLSTARWRQAVPCQWMLPTSDALHVVGTETIPQYAYIVLLEARHYKKSSRYRLFDGQGEKLGEWTAKRVERLDAVGQIRLYF